MPDSELENAGECMCVIHMMMAILGSWVGSQILDHYSIDVLRNRDIGMKDFG